MPIRVDHNFGGTIMDPYQELANAIVLQAVKDTQVPLSLRAVGEGNGSLVGKIHSLNKHSNLLDLLALEIVGLAVGKLTHHIRINGKEVPQKHRC